VSIARQYAWNQGALLSFSLGTSKAPCVGDCVWLDTSDVVSRDLDVPASKGTFDAC
jgi:hypothetical protein